MKRISTLALALSLVTSMAMAQNRHEAGPGDGGIVVDSAGTAYIAGTVFDSSTHTSTTTIKSISSNGTLLWTATVSNAHGLLLSGSNLLFSSTTRASDGTVSTALTAISTSSGSVAWTQTLNGAVTALNPFSGGTYAVVVVPSTTAGGTASRSLVAIGNDGATLWTVSL